MKAKSSATTPADHQHPLDRLPCPAGDVVDATLRAASLWRGAHPVDKMHTWLLTGCRAVYSEPVPFQIGGDRVGYRSQIEYSLGHEQVNLLDWRGLRAA